MRLGSTPMLSRARDRWLFVGAALLTLVATGAAIPLDRRMPVAAFLFTIATFHPLTLAGVSVGEHWPLVVLSSGPAGQTIIAVALLAGLGWLCRVLMHGRHTSLRRLEVGHLAMIGIAIISLINSLFIEKTYSSFIVLTAFGALPLGFIGGTVTVARAPTSWLVLLGILPVLISLGLFSDQLNPISAGTVSWVAIYFILVNWSRVPKPLAVVVVLAGTFQLLSLPELGPKVSAGAAFAMFAVQLRRRSMRGRNLEAPPQKNRKLWAFLAPVAILFATMGVSGAVAEFEAGGLNNSTVRASAWQESIRSSTLTGHGISSIEGQVEGQSFDIITHSFVIDAIDGAGWIGFVLLIIVAARVIRGVRTSDHQFTPYCVGIIVANLFSGGLFRSTSLWFGLAFLISEGNYQRFQLSASTAMPAAG